MTPPPALKPFAYALLTRDTELLRQRLADDDVPETDLRKVGRALVRLVDGDNSRVEEELPTDVSGHTLEASNYLRHLSLLRRGELAQHTDELFATGFAALHQDDVVTVATIQKSGTHWLRFFLTNYARVLTSQSEPEPINYRTLVDEYYGNDKWQVYRGAEPYRQPCDLLLPYGITDVTMQHFRHDFDPFFFTPGKRIMLYRNPLDFVISLFHYNIAQRPDRRDRASHPRDVIEPMLTNYCRNFVSLSSYGHQPDDEHFPASYEQLRRSPSTFRRITAWLGLPVDDEAISLAAALSDIRTVRQMEESDGRSMVVHIDGYFTRDGSIGQWREFFDEDDVGTASAVLASFGLNLDDFDLGDE